MCAFFASCSLYFCLWFAFYHIFFVRLLFFNIIITTPHHVLLREQKEYAIPLHFSESWIYNSIELSWSTQKWKKIQTRAKMLKVKRKIKAFYANIRWKFHFAEKIERKTMAWKTSTLKREKAMVQQKEHPNCIDYCHVRRTYNQAKKWGTRNEDKYVCRSRAPATIPTHIHSVYMYILKTRTNQKKKACNTHTSNRYDTYYIEINVLFIIFYFRFVSKDLWNYECDRIMWPNI